MALNRLLTATGLLMLSHVTSASINPQQLHDLGSRFCQVFASTPGDKLVESIVQSGKDALGHTVITDAEPIEFRGRAVGERVSFNRSEPNPLSLAVQLITPPMRAPRTVITSNRNNAADSPEVQYIYGGECTLQQAWQQFFDASDSVLYSQRLNPADFTPVGPRQWINPPLPALAPIQPPRIRVGMVDSGVNYQLPIIANALARDADGKLIGYDFWDMDAQPFDAHPAQSPFVIQRHGTRTASIVADEAPGIAIVPYRYPRPDMSRMTALIEHAAAHQVRIIGMPLGGNRHQEWAAFQRTAEQHPGILFITSAGNNGRNIDTKGVYPASLEIDNMLVVTSANDFVKPADRTNYGPLSVDYLLPAERISAMDFDGSRREVSGSSYAVSRLVALAARILNRNPSLSTDELKRAIEQRAIRARSGKYVSIGYIGDLSADTAQVDATDIRVQPLPRMPAKYRLPLDIFLLSDNWQPDTIRTALMEANRIFEQCNIQIDTNAWHKITAPPYLQNLSTGNALTLKRKLPSHQLSVFFANDTRMQPAFDAEAFGAGNTSNRPWMQNTLWITSAISDPGIAIAHELFHIITNNGRHTTDKNNLMQEQTDELNTVLTHEQCASAVSYASEAELLR